MAKMSPQQRQALHDMIELRVPAYDKRVGEALMRKEWANRVTGPHGNTWYIPTAAGRKAYREETGSAS